jgi:hypothetical protein
MFAAEAADEARRVGDAAGAMRHDLLAALVADEPDEPSGRCRPPPRAMPAEPGGAGSGGA